MHWQTIESAPKDGRSILLWTDGDVYVGRFEAEQDGLGQNGWYSDSDDWLGGICSPTHWSPLPEPPPEGE